MSEIVTLVEHEMTADERAAITAPLGAFNAARGLPFRPDPICLSLRVGERIVGGLIGHTNWDWLHIEILAVAEHLRGRGHGRRLMETTEAIARTRRCVGAWVDTYSFQSPGFYQRLGYRIFGTLPCYPGAEQRIFLMKTL